MKVIRINIKDFMGWWLDTKEDYRTLGDIAEQQFLRGEPVTIDNIYNCLGYLPLRLIENPEVISDEDKNEDELLYPSEYEPKWLRGE